jgi:glutamate---cysteine ligase / carboxylate-amine ligase
MSEDYTLGVEEEYQLIDPSTGNLISRAPAVLDADPSDEVQPELHQTTIEVATPICRSAAEVDAELRRLRFQAGIAAAAEGLRVLSAGTHPFSRWQGQRRTAGQRYRRIAEQYGRIARDEHNFGMHVHVGVPPGACRVRLLTAARLYLPHLLALAASSPFYEGQDTGYASYRMILWRRWPLAGPPPGFASAQEYRAFVDLLVTAGAIEDERSLYWSLRIHARYPTLEFRGMDACPRIDDAVAIAALARAIVVGCAEGVLPSPPAPTPLGDALLAANEWRAARFGLAARLLDPAAPAGVTLESALRRLIETLEPVFAGVGDGDQVGALHDLLDRGNAARRMRAEAGAGLPALVRWLAEETLLGTGPDRRRTLRDGDS